MAAQWMSNDEYHARPEVSKSQLDLIHEDINGIEWAKACPVDSDKLKTFDFGTAMHSILLEPETMDQYVSEPKLDKRTKAGKEELAAFNAENADKIILTAQEWKKLHLMHESVMAHPGARRLIEAPGEAEGSWFWKDSDTDIDCRCRPDKNIFNTQYLLDIKTTDSLKKFCYSVEDYRYYVQEPFYIDGMNANGQDKQTMIFLVLQKTIECGRYPVAIWHLPEDVVAYGRSEYKKDLRTLADRDENQIISELNMHSGIYRKINNGEY